jgi:predicted dehydrogenase
MAKGSERAVVVGAGGIAGAWFPPLISEGVEVVGVVDLNLATAKSRIEEYGLACKASTNLKATLAATKPDFVVDLTVPEAHCKVTCAALAAGFHVVGEKPMAASMAEARKMVRAAEESGKLYMVSQSRRWEQRHGDARAALAKGSIGEITTINCDFYIGAHFGGFRDEMPSPLILDMAIHHFDLARYLTGCDPVAVYAKEFNPKGSWYKGDVAASCIFEMSDGVVFTYRGSWCAEGYHTSWNGDWRIIGSKGTLMCEKDADPVAQVAVGNDGFHRRLEEVEIASSKLTHAGMHGALVELLTFLRTGRKPQTECHDNIKSLAMVFGAIESAKKGRRVEIAESE